MKVQTAKVQTAGSEPPVAGRVQGKGRTPGLSRRLMSRIISADLHDRATMSAPVSGKFQDHYALLGVDPRASQETIQAAYRALAEKFKPDNRQTGDREKFNSVNQAYEVLCDPYLRGEFDKIKGIDQEGDNPQFSGMGFFDTLSRQSGLRAALLSVLYDRRYKKPTRPSLSMRHIDGMLTVTNDELGFALFYLKKRGLVASDDKSNLQISVDGMEFLEQNSPAPEAVMRFLKPSAVAGSTPRTVPEPERPAPVAKPAQTPSPSAPAPSLSEDTSVVGALQRALSRR